MKLITIEEHYVSPTINRQYNEAISHAATPEELAKAKFIEDYVATNKDITDLADERIAFMDRAGVDVQLISYGNNSPMALSGQIAVELARQANDELAQACQAHPDRFYGLAVLPVDVPQAAADELKRAVTELGFRGALIQGSYHGEFLDAKRFWPIFSMAEELNVPIQIHPGEVPAAVTTSYYQGDWSPQVTMTLAGHGIGWHYDAGIHVMRLILSGLFDTYPNLSIIAGHWGEMMPYFLGRYDQMMPPTVTGLKHPISYYFKHNIYVTPSGMFDVAPMRLCLDELGADRILWSIDYPYVMHTDSREFLDQMNLTSEDRAAIMYGNACRLFKLPIA